MDLVRVRISITPEAFEAIVATLPLGSVGYEHELNSKGERLIWLEEGWINKLDAIRMPGESYMTLMNRVDAWRMVQRRAADLGTRVRIGCHTFRATGITPYLEAGGTLENAQVMAAHESPRTTKLYDRTGDEITLDEVERITI